MTNETVCINCNELLKLCNAHGCGGTKYSGWRVDMINAAIGKTPRLRKAQGRLLDAIREARKQRELNGG